MNNDIEVLFNRQNNIAYEDVVKRMSHYIHESKETLELNTDNRKRALEKTKEIRRKLETEYKNNSLQRTSRYYERNIYFERYYKPAVHEAIASISGPLSYDKVASFLYDVKYYMNYYMPSKPN